MSIPDFSTLDCIRHRLCYHNVGNGALVWRYGAREGELAGSETATADPELRIRINGRSLLAAKIAWFLSMGYWTENRLKSCVKSGMSGCLSVLPSAPMG